MKTPEEIELNEKRQILAELLEEQSGCEREFATIKSEIRLFERAYEQVLGGRIAELEQLEWQISGLLGTRESKEEHHKYFHTAESGASFSTGTTRHLDEDIDITTKIAAEKSLKSLYRKVAKAIHPDLATDEEEKSRRQELMAVANLAYQEGDRSRLSKVLKEWQMGPETAKGIDIGAELIRLIRRIAQTRQNIKELIERIEELRNSDIYCFRQRVDDGLADGIDYLAEMAATVDLDIAKARKRLAVLQGKPEPVEERQAPALETRIIRFPAEAACGVLYLRAISSVDYRDWQKLGPARGAREIPLDKGVRLDLRGDGEGTCSMEFLELLQPDDLQALFLYDVGNEALTWLSRLNGLQELYLSNSSTTDEGLKELACLSGLRRLYIYHTEITDEGLENLCALKGLRWLTLSGTHVTDEGLAAFRGAMPSCKAITFKWRYE